MTSVLKTPDTRLTRKQKLEKKSRYKFVRSTYSILFRRIYCVRTTSRELRANTPCLTYSASRFIA